MKIGHLFINTNEVNYFEIERLTSVDIRIYIYFKNGQTAWTRTNENEITDLSNRMK